MGIIVKALVGLCLGLIVYIYLKFNQTLPVPKLEEKWWGPRDPSTEDPSIKPFKINISNDIIKDLHNRIDNALPFQPPFENVAQNYGMNTNLLQKIVHYWRNQYKWTERQQFLNQYPQYTVSIQGLRLHYIHVKPKVDASTKVKVLPMLLLHGWPGSVREFYEFIPYLTKLQKGRKVVFELIVPSLPGYGFSEAATKTGLGVPQMAVVFKNLMKKLGHEKYFVQGGDWGAGIVQQMAVLYPENILGVHSNMCFTMKLFSTFKLWLLGSVFPSLVVTEEEKALIYPATEKIFQNVIMLEAGYMHLQATKPDTVGVALRDSPVGLAAYILEKFTTWTNPAWKNLDDGGLTKKFTMDQLLDNIMIYWVTRSITTSMRLYSEQFTKAQRELRLDELPVTVPSACARFKHELSITPESILRDTYLDLKQVTLHQDGGHFAAFELPEVLANDVYDFVEKLV